MIALVYKGMRLSVYVAERLCGYAGIKSKNQILLLESRNAILRINEMSYLFNIKCILY